MIRFDPDGLTDFTLNKKTGEVAQVGESNDKPDRILKTNRKGEVKHNRKGEVKVAIDNIEQGILSDGQNYKTDNNVFAIGEKGQATREGVEKFSLQLSGYVGVELAGAYFSKGGVDKITHMTIGSYTGNTYTKSSGVGQTALRKISGSLEEFQSYTARAFFHTHPNESSRFEASQADKDSRDNRLKTNPNWQFFILTYPEGYGKSFPNIIDYTKY